jgi:hypothetical protein
MRATFVIASLLCMSGISPTVAQAPPKDPARECLRIDDNPNGLGSWDEHERNRKRWIDACEKGFAATPTDKRLKSALARAYGADERRADALRLLRELGSKGDTCQSVGILRARLPLASSFPLSRHGPRSTPSTAPSLRASRDICSIISSPGLNRIRLNHDSKLLFAGMVDDPCAMTPCELTGPPMVTPGMSVPGTNSPSRIAP